MSGYRVTTLQLDVLRGLTAKNAKLRWHSYITPARPGLAGRAQLLAAGHPQNGKLMMAATAKTLVSMGYVDPDEGIDRRPFNQGGPHRDYVITDKGRAAVKQHTPATKETAP